MTADPRYPIGPFEWPLEVSPADRAAYMARIAAAPARLRQAIHHLPDSHMNAFIRFKLTLTEDAPVIKPYDEAAWALLSDATETPVETSLRLLENLHERWMVVLKGMAEPEWKRHFVHPDLGPVTLENNLALYAWHGDHHIAHITRLR